MHHNNHEKTERRYYLFLGASLLALLVVAATSIAGANADADADVAAVIHHHLRTSDTPPAFAKLTLEAHAVYVKDLATGRVLFKKNAETPLPLASLTKVMTALVAERSFDPTATITITPSDLAPDGDSGLMPGDHWSFPVLRNLMLVASSNDAAQALAAATVLSQGSDVSGFVDAMNAQAYSLGLKETSYKNPTGLDLSTTEDGAEGSAHDMATLFGYVYQHDPAIFADTTLPYADFSTEQGRVVREINTDVALESIPGIVASKTGYTDLAGGNLGVVFDVRPHEPVVVVVLGSTYDSRFTDVEKLVAATIATLK